MRDDVFRITDEVESCKHEYAPELATKLMTRLLDVDRGGALFVDFADMRRVDDEFAVRAIGVLSRALGHGPFEGKHLVVVRASKRVLTSLDEAVDQFDECYLAIADDGRVDCRGQGYSSALRDVVDAVLREPRPVDAARVSELLGITRSAASARLNELHRRGLVTKSNLPSPSGGRPTVLYTAFEPVARWKEAQPESTAPVLDAVRL